MFSRVVIFCRPNKIKSERLTNVDFQDLFTGEVGLMINPFEEWLNVGVV